ncbi:recombinase family protein [bacterium]|nr:recombinase family protein [bacterium]
MSPNRVVGIYARVSTDIQNTELQVRELTEFAKSKGWEVYRVYEEKITGTTANRPQLKQMLVDMQAGRFSLVLVWKLDRFARSLKDLLSLLETLQDCRVDFISMKDHIDLTTPAGRLMAHLIGAFAEFEASLIRERVRAGLTNAKKKGRKLGRRKERDDEAIRQLRSVGLSIRQIATKLGIAKGSVQKSLYPKPLQN